MSAEITPERIARMRRYPCISDVDDLLKALESYRAEVQRLQRERDAAIDERNAWKAGDQDSRIEADRLRGEVQRLTEEARRSDAVEAPEPTCQNCVAKWCQFHGIPGRACSDHERLSPSPQPSADVVVPKRILAEMLTHVNNCTCEGGGIWTESEAVGLLDALRSSTNHDAQDAGEG